MTKAYATFFDSSKPLSDKIAVLQDGDAFRDAISGLTDSPLTKDLSATVTSVSLTEPSKAKVLFTLTTSGAALLKNQPGYAVKEEGTWKVAAVTLCALLTLQGSPPAACSAPGATLPS